MKNGKKQKPKFGKGLTIAKIKQILRLSRRDAKKPKAMTTGEELSLSLRFDAEDFNKQLD